MLLRLVLGSVLHKYTNRVFYTRCCARCSIPRHDVCVLRPPQTDTRQQYYNTLTFLACTYACRNNVRSYACHIILWVPRNAATQTLETAGDMCVTARSSPCKYKGVWIYHTPPPSAPPPLTFKMSESVFFFIPIKTRSTYGPTIVFFFLFVSFFIVAIAQGSFAWRLILRPWPALLISVLFLKRKKVNYSISPYSHVLGFSAKAFRCTNTLPTFLSLCTLRTSRFCWIKERGKKHM